MSSDHEDFEGYTFLDCGEGRRLERFGEYLLDRQSPQSFWPRDPACAEWEAERAIFERRGKGGGDWGGTPLPERFEIAGEGLRFLLKPTDFGHLGFFPEHLTHCRFAAARLGARPSPGRLLNLFGYTGALSLYAARAGAAVTHVDASRGVVGWARDNAQHNGVQGIRWITDDVLKYVKREVKRKSVYEAIVLDPPSFGRGAQGQVFKLERDLPLLLEQCLALLSDAANFLLVSCHTPGVTPSSLSNLLGPLVADRGGAVAGGEMLLRAKVSRNALPSGTFARWVAM